MYPLCSMYLQSAREVLGTMDDKPKWASDLDLSVCGQFYQGFVDDYTLVLAQHCMVTVSTYGVRKSRKNAVQVMEDKENDNGGQTDLKVSSM